MKTLHRSILLALAPALAVAGMATAAAAEDYDAVHAKGADAVLAAADAKEVAATAEWAFTMTLMPKSGAKRQMKFQVWQRNRTQRLTEFVEPGDLKGMRILARGDNQMWVYSPQTDNVRRVAAHALRQPLLGSDITYEDMGESSFAANYTGAFDTATPTHQWLNLSKKADATASWEKLRVRVEKSSQMIDFIEYFDAGKKVREQVRVEPKLFGGKRSYRRITIKNLTSGHATELFMDEQQVKDDLPATMFIKRNLVRGN